MYGVRQVLLTAVAAWIPFFLGGCEDGGSNDIGVVGNVTQPTTTTTTQACSSGYSGRRRWIGPPACPNGYVDGEDGCCQCTTDASCGYGRVCGNGAYNGACEACTSFTTSQSCPDTNCVWNEGGWMGIGQGCKEKECKSNNHCSATLPICNSDGVCDQAPCDSFDNNAACPNDRCYWTGSACESQCGVFDTNPEDCPLDRCAFFFPGGCKFQAAYFPSLFNTNACSSGLAVSTEDECRSSASGMGLNLKFLGSVATAEEPKGCFLQSPSLGIRWNDHPQGRAAMTARPICKQVPCSDFTTFEACSPSRCKWQVLSQKCAAKDPCNIFTTSQTCDPSICDWQDNWVIDECVPKASCDSFDNNADCPSNRCSWNGAACEAKATCGGNGNGAKCKFPFMYQGTSYSTCIDALHDQPWCYTEADGSQWGNCNCQA